MKITNASLPYPVYGHEDDYRGKEANAYIKIEESSDDKTHKIVYSIDFDPENKALIEHVNSGDAVLNVELDCLATFMRNCLTVNPIEAVKVLSQGDGSITIEIDKKNYAGKVSLTGYITAVKDFVLENTGRFHPDYGVTSFNVSAGDVLAVFPCAENVDLDIDWEHMFRNAGAPVKIIRDDSRNAVMYTSLDNDYIEIHVPSKLHKVFKEQLENSPITSPLMLPYLARPAIIEVLYKIFLEPGLEWSWAKSIKGRIDSEDCFRRYRPVNGWENADLGSWQGEIGKIASLILNGADEKLFAQCEILVKTNN